jgi:hypothetical protein
LAVEARRADEDTPANNLVANGFDKRHQPFNSVVTHGKSPRLLTDQLNMRREALRMYCRPGCETPPQRPHDERMRSRRAADGLIIGARVGWRDGAQRHSGSGDDPAPLLLATEWVTLRDALLLGAVEDSPHGRRITKIRATLHLVS